ncbi:MAG TPA: dephospho-CoA kinase [Verrucomicrobiae bacterium]|jgi:dephospho-CoA kinase|nr:dephospho-CoA kinase [Verrucomicrobiae bacterium]
MKTYGLTGGVGMGKSTAGRILGERGLAVVDTDMLARQLVEPGQPALVEIQTAFGRTMLGADGHLRRDELARRVFGDADARKRLENILHPRIRAAWRKQLDEWRTEGRDRAVVTIPLLHETDAAAHFDMVICVACSAATQRQRLSARGWSAEQIQQRLDAQWPAEKKVELSDRVVWTEAGLDVHAAQLARILP